MAKRFKKILSIIVIFVMTVVNYGFPLKAIASEGASFLGFSFFKKDEVELKVYFDNDEEKLEKVANVNEIANLTIEVTPLVEEYLKEGILKFNLANGNLNNFKIKSVEVEKDEVFEDTEKSEEIEESIKEEEKTEIKDEEVVENVIQKEEIIENTTTTNSIVFENVSSSKNNALMNSALENKVEDELLTNSVEVVENVVIEKTENVIENTIPNVSTELVEDEEIVEETRYNPQDYEVKLISDNEIGLKNIIDSTKMFIELEYVGTEKINVEDLYGDIEILLEGKYINEDLETVDVLKTQTVTLGWEYSKDIEIASEYVKVSPFTVGEVSGTILENIVTVKRNIDEDNFLPIKETNIEIQIPRINDRLPIGISVSSNKLMATLGAGVDTVEFTEDNWTYDEETGILKIKVKNDKLALGNGEDKFDIICRYEEYIEAEEIELERNLKVKVEEYSSNENKIQEKKIEDVQTKEIKPGELMSCTAVESEETINKGKINANFYTEAGYETEFSDIVNVTVLTSDVIEDITLETSKRVYKDAEGNELEATGDVKYKGIKFNYNEVKEMLEKGSTIDILDEQDTVLHTITKEESECSILFESKVNNIKIRINEVAVNKTLTVELIKTIDKSSYTAEEFSKIETLESSVDVKVKYVGFEETFKIFEMKTENKFKNTITDINFTMNRDSLSAIQENENVEFKIELMNDDETSDLYRNPTFEIVFPDYVKEVKINSINSLYKNGLSITDYQVLNENGNTKIRINLDGIQKGYNFSNLTNGTNIILDTNIVLDTITPKKHDNIKLYFYNEIATSYKSEVMWSMSKEMPVGIVNQSNGYSSITFDYQTLNGFVTLNEIENYDASGNKILSINEGTKTVKIEMGKGQKVVTMNLAAVNNTDNTCSEVVFLGRIPSTETTDVVTGEKLATNIDTKLIGQIIPSINNTVPCDIYYSYKADANKNEGDTLNEWTQTPEDMSLVKSFLIVPKGLVEAGAIFEFSYNFQIPENLPYDIEIYGNFGAFYNNQASFMTTYESSKADLVGLVTDFGPRLEASLSVSVGDGEKVLSMRVMDYTVTVENTGSVTATDVKVTAPIPENTVYMSPAGTPEWGDVGFVEDIETKEFTEMIGELKPGEKKSVTYKVKTSTKPSLEEYAAGNDDGGYYIYDKETMEKTYITEVTGIMIVNKATVTSSILAEKVETNEVKNELEYANFSTRTKLDYDRSLNPGMESNFVLYLENISRQDLKNVVATFNVGQIYELSSGRVEIDEQDINAEITYNSEEGKIYFPIGDMKAYDTATIYATVIARSINTKKVEHDCRFEIKSDEMDTYENSTIVPQDIAQGWIEAKDVSVNLPASINEGEKLVISTEVKNTGEHSIIDAKYECEIPECIEVLSVNVRNKTALDFTVKDGKVSDILPILEEDETIIIDMEIKAKNMSGVDPIKVLLNNVIIRPTQPNVNVQEIEFMILNTEKTEEEILQEEKEAFEKAEEEAKKELEEELEEEELINPNPGPTEEPSEGEDNSNQPDNGNQEGTNLPNEDINNEQNNNEPENNENINNEPENKEETNNEQNEVTNNEPVEKEEVITYSINGRVWFDESKNSSREDSEKGIESVKVYLLDSNNKKIQETTTNKNGKYTFSKLENGRYSVAFTYNTNMYKISSYMKSGVDETRNSDAIESKKGTYNAITNEMTIENNNIANVDLGLQNKEQFDLQVGKYISKVIVTTSKGTKTYEYNNEEIAKIDINAKQIKGAKVELEYTVRLENTGSLDGTAEQVVDYLPSDIVFDETKNKDWYKGTDGNVYIKNIDKVTLKPGEKKEFKLYVSKTMTEENTGVISNKVEIMKAFSNSSNTENTDNNVTVQNTIITISTGRAAQITIVVIVIGSIFIGLVYTKKIPIDISFKKVYKTKSKVKIHKSKKFFK